MAHSTLPLAPVSVLYKFANWNTAADYTAATGQPAPPYDDRLDPKGWADPDAMNSPRRSVVYDVVSIDKNGQPFVDTLVLPKEVAARYNLPGGGGLPSGQAVVPMVPVPINLPDSDEELVVSQLLGGLVTVRNRAAATAADQGERAFLPMDRLLLQAIARKLGVSV